MVIWLIGLSGSGKTTIGKVVYNLLKVRNCNTVFLDGDNLRDIWGDNLGHNVKSRELNAHRISNLSYLLNNQKINVVASVLSIFPYWQKWNRNNLNNYYEIYLYSPIEFLKKQDDKGIYKKALNREISNVVGIDIPFPEPVNYDLKIDNSKRDKTPHELGKLILSKADKTLKTSKNK